MKKTIKQRADEMAQAFVAKKWETVADLTYPKIVDNLGGRSSMIGFMSREEKKAEAEGVGIIALRMGEPTQLTASGDNAFAIVSQRLELSVPGGTLTKEGYLLAISTDKGRTWTFADGEGVSQMGDAIKRIFPPMPASLVLPAQKSPTFVQQQISDK